MTKNLLAIAAISCVAILGGCGNGDTETADENGTETSASENAAVPASMMLTSAPDDSTPVGEVKGKVKEGDTVVVKGRIGGRAAPFLSDRAVFFIVDPGLSSCDQIPGDTCKKPWDYCCEPRDNLLKNMATVQIVDEQGQPLAASLQGVNGLDPLDTIDVVGIVQSADDQGNLVVNAQGIYVHES